MAIVLKVERRKMPSKVKNLFEQAERGACTIYIPTMVFAEIAYLSERKRIEATLDSTAAYLNSFSCLREYPITYQTIVHAFQIKDIPELHDRIIAGAGHELKIPVLTNDSEIISSSFVASIWDWVWNQIMYREDKRYDGR